VIDSIREELISLTKAAEVLPHRRRGRKPHVSTLFRWATGGCRGVVLETLQVGGTRCTSREALQRFFEALSRNESSPPTNTPDPSPRTMPQRLRDSKEAGRCLEKRGA
jgi:hypothetical protein